MPRFSFGVDELLFMGGEFDVFCLFEYVTEQDAGYSHA